MLSSLWLMWSSATCVSVGRFTKVCRCLRQTDLPFIDVRVLRSRSSRLGRCQVCAEHAASTSPTTPASSTNRGNLTAELSQEETTCLLMYTALIFWGFKQERKKEGRLCRVMRVYSTAWKLPRDHYACVIRNRRHTKGVCGICQDILGFEGKCLGKNWELETEKKGSLFVTKTLFPIFKRREETHD